MWTCANYHESAFASPDGKLKAVVFGRDCGAAGGASRNVSIIPANGVLPDAPSNALSLDTHDSTADDLRVTWVGDKKLKIRSADYHGYCFAARSVGDVSISYSFGPTGRVYCGPR